MAPAFPNHSDDHSNHGRNLHRRRRGLLHCRRPSPSPSPSPTPSYTSSLEPVPYSSAASVSHNNYPSNFSYLPSAPSTYIPVAPLPIFRGDPGECPAAHLTRFDRICRANNADHPVTAARIFPASLDSDAALWYDLFLAAVAEPSPPWQAVRVAFIEFFRPPDSADRARAELMSLRQGASESVNRYHLRMQGILKRWPEHGVPDALLRDIFVDGMRGDFQEWVAPQRPETVGEAVALAASWERAESVREARRRARVGDKCGFCGGEEHDESGCEVKRKMKELWVKRSSSRSFVRREEEKGEKNNGDKVLGRLGSGVSVRSSLCQCRKHRCGKKGEESEVGNGGAGVAGVGEGTGAPAMPVAGAE